MPPSGLQSLSKSCLTCLTFLKNNLICWNVYINKINSLTFALKLIIILKIVKFKCRKCTTSQFNTELHPTVCTNLPTYYHIQLFDHRLQSITLCPKPSNRANDNESQITIPEVISLPNLRKEH